MGIAREALYDEDYILGELLIQTKLTGGCGKWCKQKDIPYSMRGVVSSMINKKYNGMVTPQILKALGFERVIVYRKL